MSTLVEAILGLFDWIIPDRDPRFRRVQRIGWWLFGTVGVVIAVVVALDVFVFGSR